jgi:hypothetical protein
VSKINIHIEEWYMTSRFFFISAIAGGKEVDYRISRDDFEDFVDRHDKRVWGEGKKLNPVPWHIFYEDKPSVEEDLKEYIAINLDPMSNMFKGIEKITKEVVYANA